MLPPISSGAARSKGQGEQARPGQEADGEQQDHRPDRQERLPGQDLERREELQEGRRIDVGDRGGPLGQGVRRVEARDPVAAGVLAGDQEPAPGLAKGHTTSPDPTAATIPAGSSETLGRWKRGLVR